MTKFEDLVEAARHLIAEAARTGTATPLMNDQRSVDAHTRFNELAGDQTEVDGSEPESVEAVVVEKPKRSHRRKG